MLEPYTGALHRIPPNTPATGRGPGRVRWATRAIVNLVLVGAGNKVLSRKIAIGTHTHYWQYRIAIGIL